MAISPPKLFHSSVVRHHSDPGKLGETEDHGEDDSKIRSLPAIFEEVTSAKGKEASKQQSKTLSWAKDIEQLSMSTSGGGMKSPPKPPKKITKHFSSKSIKSKDEEAEAELKKRFSEELKKRCSRDDINQIMLPIFKEGISSGEFDKNEFDKLAILKSPDSKKFNNDFFAELRKAIHSSQIQEVDEKCICKKVKAGVVRKVDDAFKDIDDPLSLQPEALQKHYQSIADKSYGEICNQENLYTFIEQNFLTLRRLIGETLKKLGATSKSKFLNRVVEAVEILICDGNSEGLEFYKKYITKKVKDPAVRSFLLSVIHPDEEKALKTLKQLSFWDSKKGRSKFLSEIEKTGKLYLVQKKTPPFDEYFLGSKKLKDIDLKEVARCYMMNEGKRIYDVLEVNGEDVGVYEIEGIKGKECQEKFFQSFLKVLYTKGLMKGENVSDDFVTSQTNYLLNEKEFLGQDILVAGSNCAWFTCDNKFRNFYPRLYSEKYKTRPCQGTKCYIKVESKDSYSITVNKTYATFPQAPGQSSEGSWAIDSSRPLCNIEVSWQIYYDGQNNNPEKRWSHRVSTPMVHREKAEDGEWEELWDILLNRHFPETPIATPNRT